MCRKVEHPSEAVATNAAVLHLMLLPHCPGFHPYPCGDHWHVGHSVRNGRELCDSRHAGWERGQPPAGGTLQQ